MLAAYEDYLSMPKSLSADEMALVHRDIISETGEDPKALELYVNLITAATKYITFRSNWLLWTREEKMAHDDSRTACHDSVIAKVNRLAEYLQTQGHAASWRSTLGYEEENRYFRKRIGDFACYLVFVNSLLAR